MLHLLLERQFNLLGFSSTKRCGFTVIALITKFILALLAALVLPALSNTIKNNRITQANSILVAFRFFSSLAKKQVALIVVSKNSTTTFCQNAISWVNGCLMLGDVDNNASVTIAEMYFFDSAKDLTGQFYSSMYEALEVAPQDNG
jgi:Tfp pilus assembly protein FimT